MAKKGQEVQEKWKSDLAIDKYALEEECEKQAVLFTEYALAYVDQLYNLDKAKMELDATRSACKIDKEIAYSEADLAVRKQYRDKGVKPTEAEIKALVAVDEVYRSRMDAIDAKLREVEEGYIEQKAMTEEALGKKEGMKQKKDMLGHMVFLWGAEYYSDPPTEHRTVEKLNEQINLKTPIKRKRKE